MSVSANINRNTASLRLVQQDLTVRVPRIRERVAVSATNKVMKKVHTAAVREIAAETGIKQQVLRGSARSGLKGRVKFYKYQRINGRARVWAGLANIPLSKVFSGRRAATGLRKFSQYTSGSMQGRGAGDVFSARMPSGHVGYFTRKPGSKRLPIQEVKIDFKAAGERAVKMNGRRIYPVEFEREFNRDLARRLRRT